MKTGHLVLVGAVLSVLATSAAWATRVAAAAMLPASAAAADSPPALRADPSRMLRAWTIKDLAQDGITHIGIAIVPAAGTGDLTIAACSNPIVAPCIETIALSDPLLSAHIDALGAVTSVAASPADDRVVAVLVTGSRVSASGGMTSATTRIVLLERDAAGDWTSEELPFLVDGAHEPKVVYVRDPATPGAWNPAVTYVRAGARASGKSMLAERRGRGWETWKWELRELFSRASGARSARWMRAGRAPELAGP